MEEAASMVEPAPGEGTPETDTPPASIDEPTLSVLDPVDEISTSKNETDVPARRPSMPASSCPGSRSDNIPWRYRLSCVALVTKTSITNNCQTLTSPCEAGLRDHALRKDLLKLMREKNGSKFKDVREEALHLSGEYDEEIRSEPTMRVAMQTAERHSSPDSSSLCAQVAQLTAELAAIKGHMSQQGAASQQGTPFRNDVIVFGKTFEEHLHRLDEVLTRLATHGLKLKVRHPESVEGPRFILSKGVARLEKEIEFLQEEARENRQAIRLFLRDRSDENYNPQLTRIVGGFEKEFEYNAAR
ncbi:Hypp6900 [Branchiostoma lanceolatum]|uniref:Hypp6900 protein n=1 Tax=Branchiostoma lanceolatum TaxID=7740 RepID=A0A8J9YVU4_BRALA|nr:Hypp6900 [Branchiostoma lanceolatum]